MKQVLGIIGGIILFILLVYFLFLALAPLQIGQKIVERKVLENSPQYVITQKSVIFALYPQYLQAKDEGVKLAIKNQMCGIAINIPRSEWPTEIINVCN